MQKSLADQKSWQELEKAMIPETAQILLHLEGAGIYIYMYMYRFICIITVRKL